ncbi:acetate--CoA ligase family protein [Caballeronia sp. ATUFL_M1_KS5A]|uniref:acetate--CoA ligase family protein n=1 Tax=Caballeronia sp. ATUFL_M1_KS5A TaxID=2921778 RepID=UPI0020288E49|nr:acetate--CoA ligase family protein [Caballeronia sp. ATUFL_M1_KS5A]
MNAITEPPTSDAYASIHALLQPRSIAVLGVSQRKDAFGNKVFRSIAQSGFSGRIFPVNPKAVTIDGVPAFRSVGAIPEPVDCVALAINEARAEDALNEAIAAGVRAAVIFGKLSGDDTIGTSVYARVKQLAADAGMAICGSNCMGFVSDAVSLQMTSMPFRNRIAGGEVALVSHSGSTWSGLLGNQRDINFSFAVSAGQEIATTAADYIDYFASQSSTKVVACVLETVRDPGKFLAAVDRCAARGIAVVALKLGRSIAGRAFAQSHSGALAGSADVYDAVFERHGVMSVRSLDELLNTVELFRHPRRPTTSGIGVVTDSGGERQLIADWAEELDIRFPALSTDTSTRIAPWLDADAAVANPLDYWGDQGTPALAPCLQAMTDAEEIGVTVLASNLPDGRDFLLDCSNAALEVHRTTDKPIVVMGHVSSTLSRTEALRMRNAGIPVLAGTENALRALKHFASRGTAIAECRSATAAPLTYSPFDGTSSSLGAAEGFALLARNGIKVAPYRIVHDARQAAEFGREVGYPLVAKIDDPNVLHKSDIGGVMLNLHDADSVQHALARLSEGRAGKGVLLQKQVRGTELIVGMTTDAQFGPVFTVGGGGIFVEIFKDKFICLPGESEHTLRRRLEALRVFRLLQGARGQHAADIDQVVSTIARFIETFSALSPFVDEVEVNPFIVTGTSMQAADILIIKKHGA